MRLTRRLSACLAMGVLSTALSMVPADVRAQQLYEGKQFTILINFTVGGPTDTEARLLARHIGRHLPGAPTIIIRNMAGAGGAIGSNWMAQVSQPDGLMLGYFTGIAAMAAVDDPAIRVPLTDFTFAAGSPGITIAFARKDTGSGIRAPEDIMKASGFWAGGLTAETNKDIRTRMQLDMLGLSYKYVTGYKGSAELRMAVQQGEVQMMAESLPTYRSAIEPSLVNTGEVVPLWSDPIDDGASMSRSPDTEGIPALPFHEFYRKVKGKAPEGQMWEAYRLMNSVGSIFLRILLMAPNTPKEHKSAVQKALLDTQNDPAFRDEALKTIKFLPNFMMGDSVEQLFHDKLNPDPKMKAFVRAYIEEGKKGVKK